MEASRLGKKSLVTPLVLGGVAVQEGVVDEHGLAVGAAGARRRSAPVEPLPPLPHVHVGDDQ